MMRNPSPTMKSKSNTTTTPCCSKIGIKRGPWTAEEDEVLANYINKEGEGRWRTLPKRAGLLRCGKSCRLRWMNYLRPSVKRGRIAPDEEDLILRLHRLLGNRWSLIAGRIPGRTDNEIKNYWNTHLSKKLISQGIDPRTHKPLINFNPNFDSTTLNTLHDLPNNNTSSFQIKDTGTVNTKASENLTRTSTDQNQGQVANDGTGRNWSNGYNDQLIGTQQGFMRNEDITNMELNKGGCSGNDQDPFSSFLDSLIGDNVLNGNTRGMHTTATRADIIQPGGNDNLQTQLQRAFEGNPCFLDGNPIAQQQQQQQQNYVSSTQPIPLFMSSASSLNHSTTWETEMLASVAFGDHHNNNNYHLNGESVFYNHPN